MKVYRQTGPHSAVSMGAGTYGFLYVVLWVCAGVFLAALAALGLVFVLSLLLCACVYRPIAGRWPGWLVHWLSRYRMFRAEGLTVVKAVLSA